jgi:glycosyltransferase involved in cell wall biosynthesis
MKRHFISVCIISRPKENLKKCLDSLKKQTYRNKEVVVQKRIGRYSELRNSIIKKARGDIIAFIDADCYACKNWLEEINNLFQDKKIVGFFGKICYELHGRYPTAATKILSNDGEGICTANSGFRADILKRVKFDEALDTFEDWVILKRMEKEGKVLYFNDAVVFHRHQEWTFKRMLNHAKVARDYVIAEKKYNIPIPEFLGISFPKHLPIIFFPFLILLVYPIRSSKDLKIGFGIWLEKILFRFYLWKNGRI